jgi:hypothetical protein
MAVDFSLANSSNLQLPAAPQRFVRGFLLTLKQLSPANDLTKGQLYADVASSGGTPVYVISDFYYPRDGVIALNIMWRGRFYRLLAGMPTAVGRQQAYIITSMGQLTASMAMRRAHQEIEANRRRVGAINSASAAATQNNAPAQYANNPGGDANGSASGDGSASSDGSGSGNGSAAGSTEYANIPNMQ